MNYFKFDLIANTPTYASDYLVERWEEEEFKQLEKAVRLAISSGNEIPTFVQYINAKYNNDAFKLVDFRGINLSNLNIGEVDLSYCCFDHANFESTAFNKTLIQYSSFAHASLNKVKWNAVQASPILADEASFLFAKIKDSFLMHSSLEGAKFDNAIIENTAFVGSLLDEKSLDSASQLDNVDTFQVSYSSKKEGEFILELQETIVEPEPLLSAQTASKEIQKRKPRIAPLDLLEKAKKRLNDFFQSNFLNPDYATYIARSERVSRKSIGAVVSIDRKNAKVHKVGVITQNGTKVLNHRPHSPAFASMAVGDIVEVAWINVAIQKKMRSTYVPRRRKQLIRPSTSNSNELVIKRVLEPVKK